MRVALSIAAGIFLCAVPAKADDPTLIKCAGDFLPLDDRPEEHSDLFFQITSSGQVVWAVGDGLTQIKTIESNSDRLKFEASTANTNSYNQRYVVSIDRRSGNGQFSSASFD